MAVYFASALCSYSFGLDSAAIYVSSAAAFSELSESEFSTGSVTGASYSAGIRTVYKYNGLEYGLHLEERFITRGYSLKPEGIADAKTQSIQFSYADTLLGCNFLYFFSQYGAGLNLGLTYGYLYSLSEENTNYSEEFLLSQFAKEEIGGQIGLLTAVKVSSQLTIAANFDFYKGFTTVYHTLATDYQNFSFIMGLGLQYYIEL